MSIKDFNVEFRFVGIPTSLGTVCGICLSYQKKEVAESFFNYVRQNLPASGMISKNLLNVEASRELSDTYHLAININFGPMPRRISINGVDSQYITEIKESLKIFKYYLLVAGYQPKNGSFSMLPLAINHLIINYIKIDNQQYYGNRNCEMAWDALIQSKYILSVE